MAAKTDHSLAHRVYIYRVYSEISRTRNQETLFTCNAISVLPCVAPMVRSMALIRPNSAAAKRELLPPMLMGFLVTSSTPHTTASRWFLRGRNHPAEGCPVPKLRTMGVVTGRGSMRVNSPRALPKLNRGFYDIDKIRGGRYR